uniref:Uncharacterized protein n=1 Tax=Tanacetum cinerariifolium TaxID=118510 RepID=A0A6L2JA79_TANCI|nr:hypothetical protein [Tanacetum cinerariifolium]
MIYSGSAMKLLFILLHSPSTQLESYFTRSTSSLRRRKPYTVAYTLSEEDTNQSPPPIAPLEAPQMVSSVKLHILKKGENILWTMKMEQYLDHTDYALWEVILNGNDDLYNNLKVSEADIKGSYESSSNSQNVAFVSTKSTSSTNEPNAAYSVSTATGHNLEQIDQNDLEEIDLKWQVAMLSMRVKRFYKKTGRKLEFNGKEPVGFDKTKVECFNRHRIRYFAIGCRTARNPRNRGRDVGNAGYRVIDNGKRPAREEDEKALVVQDRLGTYDWSYQLKEEATNFNLMAFTSNPSSSSSLNSEVKDNKEKDKIRVKPDKIKSKREAWKSPESSPTKLKSRKHQISAVKGNEVTIVKALAVTDDISRFSWVFFLATKDETSKVLKQFITAIENQAEAVNIACYVLNRDLVTNHHNKTPYELLNGKSPSIDFMRPFGCPVTILNTLDTLDKFEGKADEGFLFGYSVNSKAFRLFNTKTKKVEENLHVRFPGNKPNVAGTGPNWLFDIDSLKKSMNYIPVSVENQTDKNAIPQDTNGNAGTQDKVDAGTEVSDQHYIVLPLWSSISSTYKSSDDKAEDDNPKDDTGLKTIVEPVNKEDQAYRDALDRLMRTFSAGEPSSPPPDALIPDDMLLHVAYDDSQIPNLKDIESSAFITPIPIHRVHIDHPKDKILGDPQSAVQTRGWQRKVLEHMLLQEEGIDSDEVFAPVARFEAIWIFLAFASFMGFIVYQMDVKSAFLYGTIEEQNRYRRGIIDKTLFIKKDKDDIMIVQDKYVAEILKIFDFSSVRTTSTPIETQKPLVKDEEATAVDIHLYRSMIGSLMYLTASRPDIMFAVCACSRFQITPKLSHLHAVKRIFRYLKGQPKLGLWYPKDSPFDLEAYSDSDYAGANLNRKSIIEGCQFLGWRLISWQCKKQTIVATSTTEVDLNYSIMADLAFAPQHNMVAYLKKTEGNAEFHQIVDFLTSSSIHHALTVSPTIYASNIEQFWNTANSQTINDEKQIHATVDGKIVRIIRGHTPGSDEVSMTLKELTDLCTTLSQKVLDLEKFKTAQAKEISSLKKRVTKLEQRQILRILGFHPFRADKGSGEKGGSTAEIVSTARSDISTARPKVSTAEPKTPPTTTTLFDDKDVTITDTLVKMKSQKAKEKGVAFKYVDDFARPIRSITTLQPLPTIDPKDKGKGILQEPEPMKKTKKRDLDQIERDAEVSLKVGSEEDEKRVRSIKKRAAGSSSKHKSPKKQKVNDQESINSDKELKKCLKVVPDNDKAINYETLDVKSLIFDCESQKLGKIKEGDVHVYKLTRLDESYRYFSTFSRMLEFLDRQDVLDLHKIVMERFPANDLEGYDLIL